MSYNWARVCVCAARGSAGTHSGADDVVYTSVIHCWVSLVYIISFHENIPVLSFQLFFLFYAEFCPFWPGSDLWYRMKEGYREGIAEVRGESGNLLMDNFITGLFFIVVNWNNGPTYSRETLRKTLEPKFIFILRKWEKKHSGFQKIF